MGVQAVVSIGTAGSLQRSFTIGPTVVRDRTVRDEGVSHHYLTPGQFAHADATLTPRLQAELETSSIGTSWTIDTPFRETVEEARYYQSEGVLCVEMEAAALFAVAEVRGLRLASAFVISDSLAELVWNPRFHDPAVQAGLVGLYQAAVTALLAEPER